MDIGRDLTINGVMQSTRGGRELTGAADTEDTILGAALAAQGATNTLLGAGQAR